MLDSLKFWVHFWPLLNPCLWIWACMAKIFKSINFKTFLTKNQNYNGIAAAVQPCCVEDSVSNTHLNVYCNRRIKNKRSGLSLSLSSNEIKLLYSECVSSVLSLAMHLQRKLTTPRNDIFGFVTAASHAIICFLLYYLLLRRSQVIHSCLRRNAHFSNCVTFLNYPPVQARYRLYE